MWRGEGNIVGGATRSRGCCGCGCGGEKATSFWNVFVSCRRRDQSQYRRKHKANIDHRGAASGNIGERNLYIRQRRFFALISWGWVRVWTNAGITCPIWVSWGWRWSITLLGLCGCKGGQESKGKGTCYREIPPTDGPLLSRWYRARHWLQHVELIMA